MQPITHDHLQQGLDEVRAAYPSQILISQRQETQKSYFLAPSLLPLQRRDQVRLAASKAQVLDNDRIIASCHGIRSSPTFQARLPLIGSLDLNEVLRSGTSNASAATTASGALFEPCSMCHAIRSSLSLALHNF